jgi:hypothetical protein
MINLVSLGITFASVIVVAQALSRFISWLTA